MSDEQPRPRAVGLRWLAGGVALAIAGAITLATASANAAPRTVNAELSFSGIATTANLLGGAQIGVHPGDTVNFVPSTIPTAGLTILTALGQLLPFLSEKESHLALFHGARRVAADCDGAAPRREREPLASRPDLATLKGWLRRWIRRLC